MERRLPALLLQSVLALACFAVGAALVRPWVPFAEGGRLHLKLEYFARRKDTYDAVVIGSSRVIHGLDTLRVEQSLAREGRNLRVFNFGARAMRTFEQDFLLHHVLALGPERLRYVFHAGGPVGTTLADHHAYSDDPTLWSARGVQWHTPAVTRRVLESVVRIPVSPGRKLELAATHVELLLRNLTSFGRGKAIWRRLTEGNEERQRREKAGALVHRQRGFRRIEEEEGPETGALLREADVFHERIAEIPGENALSVELAEINTDVYREQLDAAAERGIELIYVTPPAYRGTPEILRLHELGIVPELLHFNDPERFPELFEIRNRYDRVHLNRRGVELFSDRFAEAVLSILMEREPRE